MHCRQHCNNGSSMSGSTATTAALCVHPSILGTAVCSARMCVPGALHWLLAGLRARGNGEERPGGRQSRNVAGMQVQSRSVAGMQGTEQGLRLDWEWRCTCAYGRLLLRRRLWACYPAGTGRRCRPRRQGRCAAVLRAAWLTSIARTGTESVFRW